MPDSIVYSGSFTNHDVLDVSSCHYRRIDHGKGFAEGEENKRHINGALKLLEPGKTALRRYNGIPRKHFYYFLKECEWRFNGGNHKELYRQLIDKASGKGCFCY